MAKGIKEVVLLAIFLCLYGVIGRIICYYYLCSVNKKIMDYERK